jgi:hypothetical protein
LLRALERGVVARILVAQKAFVPPDSEAAYDKALARMQDLKDTYPEVFDFAHFDHTPRTSLVLCDDDLIVGPYFPEKASKHTPAVHISAKSEFADAYIKHFDLEWGKHSQ